MYSSQSANIDQRMSPESSHIRIRTSDCQRLKFPPRPVTLQRIISYDIGTIWVKRLKIDILGLISLTIDTIGVKSLTTDIIVVKSLTIDIIGIYIIIGVTLVKNYYNRG